MPPTRKRRNGPSTKSASQRPSKKPKVDEKERQQNLQIKDSKAFQRINATAFSTKELLPDSAENAFLKWKTLGEDGIFDHEDDESIASSEAETDGEDDVQQPTKNPRLSSKQPTNTFEVNLDEDSESDSKSTFTDQGMDLSEMLETGNLLPSESEDSDQDMSPPPASDDDDDQENDQEAIHKLDDFVSALSSKAKGKQRQRILPEMEPPGEEREFAALPGRRLRLEDMLASLDPAQANELRKATKSLQERTGAAVPSAEKSIFKQKGPLSAPLDSRRQAKIDRVAARDKLYEEADKWNETVQNMKGLGTKESELGHHRIHLPLLAPDLQHKSTTAELSSRFAPRSEMEQRIASILDAQQAGSLKQQTKAEEQSLTSLGLSAEEQAERVSKLRRERDLLFRAERKAKRVSKIKSKSFRKLARKAKSKADDTGIPTFEEMEQMDALDGGSRVADERERLQTLRARERATLKHSSGKHGSRWVKEVQGLHGMQDEVHQEARDRLAREDELRHKIVGEPESDPASDGDSSSEVEQEAAAPHPGQHAFDEVAAFDAQEKAKATSTKMAGLMGMKFMQKAKAQQQAATKDFDLEMDRAVGDAEDELEQPAQTGRRTFAPGPLGQTAQTALPSSQNLFGDDDFVLLDEENEPDQNGTGKPSVNPWLTNVDAIVGKRGSKQGQANGATSLAEKSALKTKKSLAKSKEAIEKQQLESSVLVDPTVFVKRQSKGKGQQAANAQLAGSDDEATNASDADDDINFRQQDLVARAFAEDNVVADFTEEKRRVVEADAPQELDDTIPGWGSWGGKGVRKKKNAKKFTKVVPGLLPTDRQDADLANVIINEKRDRKSVKYLVKDLPYPYTNAGQHEQSLSQPLGREWQTLGTTRALTRPNVLTKAGTIIQPVSATA